MKFLEPVLIQPMDMGLLVHMVFMQNAWEVGKSEVCVKSRGREREGEGGGGSCVACTHSHSTYHSHTHTLYTPCP